MNSKWSNNYAVPGFFPELGDGVHAFGGADWQLEFPANVPDVPAIILTLNVADPCFKEHFSTVDTPTLIPLASFLNSNIPEKPQKYQFNPESRVVKWVNSFDDPIDCFDSKDRLAIPFPKRRLKMRPMGREDVPITEDDYWRIGDEFLGGTKFIRILGAPYWSEQSMVIKCNCGRDKLVIAQIGYECHGTEGVFNRQAFFCGEFALYFFVCMGCREMTVISQSI